MLLVLALGPDLRFYTPSLPGDDSSLRPLADNILISEVGPDKLSFLFEETSL
jgi:hypothetical protein